VDEPKRGVKRPREEDGEVAEQGESEDSMSSGANGMQHQVGQLVPIVNHLGEPKKERRPKQ